MLRVPVISALAAVVVVLGGTVPIAIPPAHADSISTAFDTDKPTAGNLTPRPSRLSAALARQHLSSAGVKGQLLDVTAISAKGAWAVGYDKNRTFILRWDGRYWVPVPSPSESEGRFRDDVLGGVSAVSGRDAWAVGIVATPSFDFTKDLIERWNGTRWSRVPSPSPPSPDGYIDTLDAVAAISANDAWAVGADDSGSLILHWNGKRWLQVRGVQGVGELNDVVAISRTDAWAVGYTVVNGSENKNLILHWNGKSWRQVPCPSPGKLRHTAGDDLYGVAASSARNVWAVGVYEANAKASGSRTLVLRWTGRAWEHVPSPNPACRTCDAGDFLSAAATTGPADVWAVGGEGAFSGQNLTEHWDGHRWTPEPSPNLDPGGVNELGAVTAVSANLAWAVGGNLIAQWNGSAWTVADSPSLAVSPDRGLPGTSVRVTGKRFQPGEKVMVTDATVSSAPLCSATAASNTTFSCSGKIPAAISGPQRLVAAGRSSGARVSVTFQALSPWTLLQAPLPSGAGADPFVDMYSVACPSASQCLAVGSYADSALIPQGLIETWSGNSWTPARAPVPAGQAGETLESVACTAVSSCVAVGNSWDFSSALVETLSGSTWTPTQPPLPAGSYGVMLRSVACSPDSAVCSASGTYQDASTHIEGVLVTRTGTRWTATRAPMPRGAATSDDGISLPATACPSASTCIAVGNYLDSSRHEQGLLETLSNGNWNAIRAPLPAGAATNPDVTLTALACRSAAACVADGNYTSTSGLVLGLVETWSDGSWTPARAPMPADAIANPHAKFSSITCETASFCVGSGTYDQSDSAPAGLFETWSGTTWTATPAPVPNSHSDAFPQTVACISSSACMAAGATDPYSGTNSLLLETLSRTRWTPAAPPLPSDASFDDSGGLVTVACVSSAFCAVATNYTDKAGNVQGLLATGPD